MDSAVNDAELCPCRMQECHLPRVQSWPAVRIGAERCIHRRQVARHGLGRWLEADQALRRLQSIITHISQTARLVAAMTGCKQDFGRGRQIQSQPKEAWARSFAMQAPSSSTRSSHGRLLYLVVRHGHICTADEILRRDMTPDTFAMTVVRTAFNVSQSHCRVTLELYNKSRMKQLV